MNTPKIDIVAIGGSAGSLPLIMDIIAALPEVFSFSVIVVLHRQRNVNSELTNLLGAYGKAALITEPDDKDRIRPGHIYLAPQNYHLLVEDHHFSLDYSEPVMYSRPSIDVAFESIANAYGPHAAAVLLSGANHDGASGIKSVADAGGYTIVQDPDTAEYPVMPRSAMGASAQTMSPQQILQYIRSLNQQPA